MAGELGWTPEELLGGRTTGLLVDLDHAQMARARSEVFDGSGSVTFDRVRVRRRDGGHRWMSLSAHASDGPDGVPLAVVSLRDVEQEMAEHRTVATLSAGNGLVAVADDEFRLLRDMCRMVVDVGGFRFAWYGRRSPAGGDARLVPFASSDEFADYLDGLVVSTGGGPYGRGPTGTASRTGRTVVVDDVARDDDYSPWSDRALARGFRSSASVPVLVDGQIDGVLTVFAAERDGFDQGAVALLEELSATLGYGIGRLRDRSELRQAFVNSIDLVAAVVESRDPYTAGHQALVADLARAIGAEMGLEEHRLNGLSFAARIHDVGKIGVPIDLLCRPGRLVPEEMAVVRRHATMGWEIAGHFDWPWPIADIIHQHHEHVRRFRLPPGTDRLGHPARGPDHRRGRHVPGGRLPPARTGRRSAPTGPARRCWPGAAPPTIPTWSPPSCASWPPGSPSPQRGRLTGAGDVGSVAPAVGSWATTSGGRAWDGRTGVAGGGGSVRAWRWRPSSPRR